MAFPINSLTVPLLKDVKSQMPQASLHDGAGSVSIALLIVNQDKPPFDNPDLRRAMGR